VSAALASTFRAALTGAAVFAVAACKGESPTDPGEPHPYHIVLERREGPSGPPDLYVLDLQTGAATRLLGALVGGMQPHGSPNGERVAFVRTDNEFNSEVFIVRRDGTGLTNISNHAEPDIMPAWSPAGGRIAFVTDRAGWQDIFIINSDGTGLRRLTPPDQSPAVSTEWWPAWSPSNTPGGQLIAYSSTVGGTADIWTIDVDVLTAAPVRRTGTVDSDSHPTWNLEGTRIAFERLDFDTGDSDIAILTISTGAVQTIRLPGQQVTPAWSPDGTLIAFASNHEGDSDLEIYTMRPDGTEIRRRTDNALFDLRPTWLLR